MQSLLLICCSIMLLTIVFIIATIGDKHDSNETISTTPEWLENYRLKICCSLSNSGVVTDVNQVFQEIQKLLDIWDDLYGDNPELISEQKDVRSLFEITVRNIEHFCLEYKKGKLAKNELLEELDEQIARLNDLLRSLASLTKTRASFV